ncbi:MAG: DUF4399 domain-containing protein [Cyanobacteria bacterium J06641_5]
MKRAIALACLLLSFCFGLAWAPSPAAADDNQDFTSPSPEGAYVYFIEPCDTQEVDSTFAVKFGLAGMGVAPAGIDKPNTGHHHLIIDLDELPDLSTSLAATDNIKHFGGGQTETRLTLPAGEHTLQLLLGNYVHIPHDKPVLSEKIVVNVR